MASDFVAVVRERLGIELEIVDRETEAHLAAAGVGDLADKEARSTVMFDIGGGSSEIIWLGFDPRAPQATNRVKAWESLRLGVVSLAETFGGVDVSEEAFVAMTDPCLGRARAFRRPGGGRDALRSLPSSWHLRHGDDHCGRASQSAAL